MTDTSELDMRIMVIEDSPGDARLIIELLTEAGFDATKVVVVETMAAGREHLAHDMQWDALLIDLNLPDTRGMDTLEAVLQIAEAIPILVMTGLDDHSLAVNAVRNGAQDFVVKGETDAATLRKSIEFAVARRRLLTRLEATEARERFLNRLLRTTSEINQLIVREHDPQKLLAEAARLIVEVGDFLAAWFATGDPFTGEVHFLASYGVIEEVLADARIRCDDTPTGRGATGTALREQRTVIVSDLASDVRVEPWREKMSMLNLRSAIAVPLTGGTVVHGVLTVCAADPDSFVDTSQEVFEELGADLGFALSAIDTEKQRVRAETELRWQARLDGALAELYEPLVAPGATIERVAEIVIRRARELTTSEDGYAATVEPASGNVICQTSTGMLHAAQIANEQPRSVLPPNPDGTYPALWGHSLNTRSALLTNEPNNHPAGSGIPPGHVPVRAVLSVPVLIGGELVGQITLANPQRPYNPRDLSAIQQIARFYALAIQRIRADEAIQESERQYRELFERNLAGVYRTTTDGAVLDCNQAFATFFGAQDPEQMATVSAWELYFSRQARQEFIDALLTEGEVHGWEQEFRRLDGATVFALLNANLHHRADETIIEGTLADITAIRAAHEALAARERDYRGLFESAHDAIIVFDPVDATILEVNQRTAQLYEMEYDQLIGFSMLELSAEPERAWERIQEIVRERTIQTFEARHRTAAGARLSVEINGSHVDYRGHEAILAIIRDITATRELEEQLHHSQRMEAIGRLAGGVAHDFNNLLQAVAGTTQALRSGRDPKRNQHRFDELEQLVERGAQLTRQLLVFSRRDAVHPEVLDLNEALNGSLRMIARLIPESISVSTELAPGAMPVLLDPGRLEQVLVNLAVNAADAMPDGGQLRLRTSHCYDGVILEMTDTGVGMSADVAERIFEPFFTTKEAGAGTGLGLAVVHGIVVAAGGTISVTSEPDRGSTFHMWLPKHHGTSTHETEAATTEEPGGHGERILAVDDNEGVREGVGEMLELIGYEVTLADSLESASTIEMDPPPDVLLTDMVLEDGTGIELAERLRARWPGLPVVVMSGYSQDLTDVTATEIEHYLQKPFTIAELAQALRSALDHEGRHDAD